ncbi:MAG: tetratricopeptide repeat protein, partial [Bryobacteraceae bacterium]
MEEALRRRPESAEAWEALAVLYRDQDEVEQAVACFERALELNPGAMRAASGLLLTLNYVAGLDPMEIYWRHRAWARKFADPLMPLRLQYGNRPDPDRP